MRYSDMMRYRADDVNGFCIQDTHARKAGTNFGQAFAGRCISMPLEYRPGGHMMHLFRTAPHDFRPVALLVARRHGRLFAAAGSLMIPTSLAMALASRLRRFTPSASASTNGHILASLAQEPRNTHVILRHGRHRARRRQFAARHGLLVS